MRTSMRCRLDARSGVRDGGEQQLRVRMQRLGEHLLDRPLLDDLAGVHDEDVVGDVARAREIVRDVEERDLALLLQLRASGSGSRSGSRRRACSSARRRAGRRLDRERARDRDALPLAARELVRVLLRDVLRRDEADRAQQLVHALLDLRRPSTMPWIRSGRSMWWRIVLTGFSEPNGSWKIICTCER